LLLDTLRRVMLNCAGELNLLYMDEPISDQVQQRSTDSCKANSVNQGVHAALNEKQCSTCQSPARQN